MGDTAKVIIRFDLEGTTKRQQAIRYLNSLDLTKQGEMLGVLKNAALTNPYATYPVDLA